MTMFGSNTVDAVVALLQCLFLSSIERVYQPKPTLWSVVFNNLVAPNLCTLAFY